MVRLIGLTICGVLLLTACGPSRASRTNIGPVAPAGYTGYTDPKDNQPYLSGGDPYVDERMRSAQPPPTTDGNEESTTTPATPATPSTPGNAGATPTLPVTSPAKTPEKPKVLPARNALTERVREFEISRFNSGEVQQAKRFGSDSFEFKVFFKRENSAVFKGKLTKRSDNSYALKAESESFSISGELSDDPKKEKSTAVLILTDNKSKESLEISYRAFRAILTLHEDQEAPIREGSDLATQVKSLSDKTFGWVNNWTVINGPSFYLVDIIRYIDGAQANQTPAPRSLAFRGESKRTAGEENAYEYEAETLTPDAIPQVKLIGNNENGAGRAFMITLEDKQTKEKAKVVLDVEPEDTTDNTQQTKPEDIPDEYGSLDGDGDVGAPAPTTSSPSTPSEKPKASAGTGKTAPATTRSSSVIVASDAFLKINMSKPRTARMFQDMSRYKDLAGVRQFIAAFQKEKGQRRRLENYFYFMNPAKDFANLLSEAVDVNPVWSALSVDESVYFTGGNYVIQVGDSGQALGPFQLHVPAATQSGVYAHSSKPSNDERRFYAPSACGAAKYLAGLANQFWKTDTTLAILAYNQGGGGAEKFARQYGYDWSRMDRMRAQVSAKLLNYVNSKLAIYFISNNRHNYGFDTRGNTNRQLPSNFAPQSMRSEMCKSIISQTVRGS